MPHPFNVVCYRKDFGIFTIYGAKIKQCKNTYAQQIKAVNNLPAINDLRFIDKIFYEVILYTNIDQTQSFTCYRNKDLCIAQNYLDNLIFLITKGYRYIDLDKIPEKPFKPNCIPNPPKSDNCKDFYKPFKPHFNKHDKCDDHIPDCEIDPRYINDPRKNPYYDTFENLTRENRYFNEPNELNKFCNYDDNIDMDYTKLPKYDGEIMKFECKKENYPDKCPYPDIPSFPNPIKHNCNKPIPLPPINPCPNHPRPVPPCPPYFPPIPPPPFKEKIFIYYGNGGFSMGESVESNIKELSSNALRTMISKNYHSTFSNMNPEDRIVVKKEILNCILPDMVFKTNMHIAGEWSFIMVPDKFYKLIEDFNWYYKEDTYDGIWNELDKKLVQTTFTFQDNGIRYFVSAVRLNGRYDMRFAKSGRDFNEGPIISNKPDDNRELDVDMKFVISIYVKNCIENEYITTVEDLSVTNQVVRVLSDFIHDELAWQAIENHVYELKIYSKEDKEKSHPLATKYFIAIPDANYKHGFCTWISDSYDSELTLIDNNFERVTDLKEPKTPSAVDRIVLTEEDIQ